MEEKDWLVKEGERMPKSWLGLDGEEFPSGGVGGELLGC